MTGRDRVVCFAIAIAWISLAASTDFVAHEIYDTAERAPGDQLVALADPELDDSPARRRAVIVLIDGLRRDEALAMRSVRALKESAVEGRVALDLPTLSQPYYHAFMTGVPQRGTGVRLNREGRRARADSLADRVRARGGRVTWLSDDIDWFAPMFDAEDDEHIENETSLAEAVAMALPRMRDPEGPTFLFIHDLAVDASAHAGGIHTRDHERALAEANSIIGQADVATRGVDDVVLMVVADHGHIERGGHGGDEPEVATAPIFLRAPGLAPSELDEPLHVEQLAPTIAWWMGISQPLTSVGALPLGLAPGSTPSEAAAYRAQIVERMARASAAQLNETRLYLAAGVVVLCCLAIVALMGTLRGSPLGAWASVAPIVYLGVIAIVHRVAWQRPFSMSAIDDIDWRGPYLAALGAGAAFSAVAICALIAWLRARGTMRPGVLEGMRGGALVIGTFVWLFALAAWASIGGALGPWSLPAPLFYSPILTLVTGAGASIACALLLVIAAIALPGPSKQ